MTGRRSFRAAAGLALLLAALPLSGPRAQGESIEADCVALAGSPYAAYCQCLGSAIAGTLTGEEQTRFGRMMALKVSGEATTTERITQVLAEEEGRDPAETEALLGQVVMKVAALEQGCVGLRP